MGEFLPLLVAVVIGLITTFSRMKGQSQGNSGKPMMPPQLDPMHPKHFENKMPQKTEVPMKSTFEHTSKPSLQNETSVHSFENTHVASKRVNQQEDKKVNEPIVSTSTLKNLNKKKLIEGVIMAEVLGPPRALKPLRSSHTGRLPK
ncbi:hypothetical protein [Bacillus suaedaesalsae]|uniref:Uncharacterized protein n=1 Tax=Bacillus suaedaesalsae TaxID=2810349 RepID=A0ABS2DL86_9BACI|nr:hypothetical protein [Bacillus suaedaesalsae]MBM6619255.1 hypothetical protein [Bacillus suaedaesalsae]